MLRFSNGNMTSRPHFGSALRRPRQGYTLVELVMAMMSASALVGGLAATVFLSTSVQSRDSTPGADANRASLALSQLAADVRQAIRFRERTATAITIQVPDRDGDATNDTIRYSWSGTAGDPLMYQFNTETAITLIADVKQFELTAITRQILAP
ncbi:MAG TPA: hypothetical protein VF175_09030 [Lacipirellula sp.]